MPGIPIFQAWIGDTDSWGTVIPRQFEWRLAQGPSSRRKFSNHSEQHGGPGGPWTCSPVKEGRQAAHSPPACPLPGIQKGHQAGLENPLVYHHHSQSTWTQIPLLVTPTLPLGEARDPTSRPLSPRGCRPQAEQPKVLSAVEDRMDELGAGIAQSRRTVALIKVRSRPPPPASTPAAGCQCCELSAWHRPPQRSPCPGHGQAPLSTPASPLTWRRPRAGRAGASVHPRPQQDTVGNGGVV